MSKLNFALFTYNYFVSKLRLTNTKVNKGHKV